MLTLPEVRENIDRVDREIRELFMERMQLADQVAQIKAQTEDKIYKPDREKVIIENQSKDMPDAFVMEYRAFIRKIMAVSRKYQYGRTLQLRDCFPYTYLTEEVKPETLGVAENEPEICDFDQEVRVQVADSFDTIGALVKSGALDAGAGIMEEVGKGVNNALNETLRRNELYINRCRMVEEKGSQRKVVQFSSSLVVREDHNRLKVVLVIPNKSGALSSILSMISDYDVNLTEIHSVPYKEEKSWNYYFYMEMGLNFLKPQAQALIYQLSQETVSLQILGSYFCEGDFR